MRANNDPKVSIGLPVYNGENFLEEALDSFLSQTFEDFELIISDNASMDRTEAICQAYAAQDGRVRYFRNQENIGASGNFRRVFELASGEYFKWAAHDDICRPDFLLRCVELLDQDPSVVLCYARTITIDAEGKPRKEWDARTEFGSAIPHRRFREALAPVETFPIWGLIRTSVLRETPLLGDYTECDRPLLTELSLYGRFYEIPEFLFLSREHRQRSVRVYDWRKPHEAVVWYDPKMAGKTIFPAWRLLAEYVAGINRAPIDWRERMFCYIEVTRWLRDHAQELLRDLAVAAGHIPTVGPVVIGAHEKLFQASWSRRTGQLVEELESVVAPGETFILVDEATLEPEAFAMWQTIPFLEREGEYWGLPPDDNTAIQELERLRRSGAGFAVFAWPTFWWFEHYVDFHRYLHDQFHCIMQDQCLVVFELG